MPTYRTPGLYFEWLDTRRTDVDIARTDIAGFVGIAQRGPLHKPVKIESWTQFTSTFGDRIAQGYLAYSIDGFFANGGRTCWVVRAADPDQARPATLDLAVGAGSQPLKLTASSPGVWANQLIVSGTLGGSGRFNLTFALPDGTEEVWSNVTLDPKDPRFVETLLNDEIAGSRLVRVGDSGRFQLPPGSPSPRPSAVSGRFSQGADGLATLGEIHLSGYGAPDGKLWGLATLEPIREIAMIAIPDIMAKPVRTPAYRKPAPRCGVLNPTPVPPPPEPEPEPEFAPSLDVIALENCMILQCEKLKDRVAILDVRREDPGTEQVLAFRNWLYPSRYGALYYPWIMPPDPLALGGLLRPIPPSGHVAGIYARVDRLRGVHKPPANEIVEDTEDVTIAVDDIAHGILNDNGVNVIRTFNGRNIRVAGARTLADPSDTQWIYVNVRRLLIMIERSIDSSTQWIVFEPNNQTLWKEVDRVVRSFLDRLWRRGFLDGASREEAYSVTCDQTTNTEWETDQGRLICEIGIRPPWPAEFVIVRIGVTTSGVELLNAMGAQSG